MNYNNVYVDAQGRVLKSISVKNDTVMAQVLDNKDLSDTGIDEFFTVAEKHNWIPLGWKRILDDPSKMVGSSLGKLKDVDLLNHFMSARLPSRLADDTLFVMKINNKTMVPFRVANGFSEDDHWSAKEVVASYILMHLKEILNGEVFYIFTENSRVDFYHYNSGGSMRLDVNVSITVRAET